MGIYLKVNTIKILLNSSASASIIHKDSLHQRHQIFKDKKNKWLTIAGTFNITFVVELKLKRKMSFDQINY